MLSVVKIDSEFVTNKVRQLCKKRRDIPRSDLLLCNLAELGFYCPVEANAGFNWEGYAEHLGTCIFGHRGIDDWTDDISLMIDLGNCLKSSANIDWLLHLSKKRYRDHASHQLFVGILGWFLLECEVSNDGSGQTLREWIHQRSALAEDEIDIAWWIASLLHDHAYPLSHMLRVVPSITEEPIFDMDSELPEDMDNAPLPGRLRQKFEGHSHFLSEDATISTEEENNKWLIIDADNVTDTHKSYIVKKEGNKLNIYAGNRETLLDQTWALLGARLPDGRPNQLKSILGDLYTDKFLEGLRKAVTEDSCVSRRKRVCQLLKDMLINDPTRQFFSRDEICINQIIEQCHISEECYDCCYDHGMLAAANIASMVGEFDEKTNCIKAAIRAIGIHNGIACRESVDINKDPLAFLLILCDECQEWERRIVVRDYAEAESSSIRLLGLEETEGGKNYVIGKKLTVVFDYTDAALEDTGWDYLKFKESKDRAFKRFRISDDFPIKQVDYHVVIPHERPFLSNEK